MLANPKLTGLLREVCGEAVLDDFSLFERLEARASDNAFQQQFPRRQAPQQAGAGAADRRTPRHQGRSVGAVRRPDQAHPRIQAAAAQHRRRPIALYQAIKDEPQRDWVPRVKIFAGKAAASYRYRQADHQADQRRRQKSSTTILISPDGCKVVFLADYNVSLAEVIIPAADLSEQISTAGMEASGTGNMKLALNGALTIGTLDGANIEIRDHVGAENIAIFGMEAGDVMVRRKQGLDATDVISRSPRLARAITAIESGAFSPDDPARFASDRPRAALSRPLHGLAPISIPTTRPSAASTPAGRWCRPGRAPRSSTWRGCRGSPPTAPSANMPRRSGTCRCARPRRCRRPAPSAGRRGNRRHADDPYL